MFRFSEGFLYFSIFKYPSPDDDSLEIKRYNVDFVSQISPSAWITWLSIFFLYCRIKLHYLLPYIYIYIYIYKRFMILTSSLGELMEDQMLVYCLIVLNINDRAFIYIYIYITWSQTVPCNIMFMYV